MLVDSEGRLWAVHAANVGDGPGALSLVPNICYYGDRLEEIYGDQAYNGVFAEKIAEYNFYFGKASRTKSTKGFVPAAKRWVVERTIS